jgi:hypothetical protein
MMTKVKLLLLIQPEKLQVGKKRNCMNMHESFNTLGPFDACGFFFTKESVHAKNEQCYTVIDYSYVLDHLQANVLFEQRWKYVQFVIIYHLLANGRPMTNYESLKNLF